MRADETRSDARPRPRSGALGAAPRTLFVVALLALALVVQAGCGGDDDDGPRAETEKSTAPADGSGGDSDEAGGSEGSRGGRAGGGGGDAGSGGGSAREGSDGGGLALSGDRGEARRGGEAVERLYEGFDRAVEAGIHDTGVPVGETLANAERDDSLTQVCALLSERARRQTVDYARRSAGLADIDWSCEKATGLLLRRARQSGSLKRSLRAEVVGVNAQGDRATATVRFGDRPLTSVPLVMEDGDWKLGTAPGPAGG